MSFEIHEHTADIEIVGTGDSIGAAFASVADGMAAAICDEWPEVGDRFSVALTAESLEALLFDYLDELIYLRDVKDVLPVDNEADVNELGDRWEVTGSFQGVPLSRVVGREIKAPTYADMDVTQNDRECSATVVLDV